MKRLFVDMDGTLVEWKPATPEELEQPHFFAVRPSNGNVVKAMHILYTLFEGRTDVELFTLSSAVYKEDILRDKNKWLDKHCPHVLKNQRKFVPYGMNKATFVQEHFDDAFSVENYLLDDYSKNIKEWRAAGGTPIKMFNGINGKSGSFYGDYTCSWLSPEQIATDILRIMQLPLDIPRTV